MRERLTLISPPDPGWVVLTETREGWHVAVEGDLRCLAEPARIEPGRYSTPGRATTTKPDAGIQPARYVFILECEDGLRAVETHDATYEKVRE
jgi:hypothetical protein